MNTGQSQLNRVAALALALLLGLAPNAAQACAACYGKSDSPLAEGLNIGIFALLGCITLVMLWIAGFFYYLARRSGAEPAAGLDDSTPTAPTNRQS